MTNNYGSLDEQLRNATSPKDEPDEKKFKDELHFLYINKLSKSMIGLKNSLAFFYRRVYKGYENIEEAFLEAQVDLGRLSEEADDLFGTRPYGQEVGNIKKFFFNSLEEEYRDSLN